ncbi:hypothetical protein Ae706Ps2_4709 [Pseudonocardia sp. Ae706_Ps2]|nr:hypothetical protein Ae706Ps2_4709 [Pseudonocardia sp. Ae706_Ps2]
MGIVSRTDPRGPAPRPGPPCPDPTHTGRCRPRGPHPGHRARVVRTDRLRPVRRPADGTPVVLPATGPRRIPRPGRPPGR